MADQNFITSPGQIHGDRGMASANGGAPLTSINHDFEEKAIMERAQKMGMSYVDVASIHINPDHLKTITSEEAYKALVVPFFRIGKKVRLALAHPTKPETQDLIRKLKQDGYAVNVNLASETGLRTALEAYKVVEGPKPLELQQHIDESKIASYQQEIESLSGMRNKLQNVTAEEALNVIQIGALKTGASDIHYQPEEHQVRVRFRIDGVLEQVLELDLETYGYLSNQIKFKSGMRLNVNNIPQDGRYGFTVNERKVDVRVSSIPTEYGESFVCRLLDSNKRSLNFEELGFEGENLKALQGALSLPSGMILVTGPTGSGKTTTLYSLLNAMNQPESKIITLEDPIEYHLEGVIQSQINEKRGYNFASGLRAILRQDPDVVMIGEIRDAETAETASQAALTGHVVLSTLHTNSAIETVARLLNMGLKPFMVAPALGMVMAQRLVRKVCPYCVTQEPIQEGERKTLSAAIEQIKQIRPDLSETIPATLPHALGCEKCSHSGYMGQVSIAELFRNTVILREAILREASMGELFDIVRSQGMLTMGEDGVLKVLRGVTTLTEVERVTDISVARTAAKISATQDTLKNEVKSAQAESLPQAPQIPQGADNLPNSL